MLRNNVKFFQQFLPHNREKITKRGIEKRKCQSGLDTRIFFLVTATMFESTVFCSNTNSLLATSYIAVEKKSKKKKTKNMWENFKFNIYEQKALNLKKQGSIILYLYLRKNRLVSIRFFQLAMFCLFFLLIYIWLKKKKKKSYLD